MTRRIHANHAHWSDLLQRWIFEQGWTRSFEATKVEEFRPFEVAIFNELNEPPAYFK